MDFQYEKRWNGDKCSWQVSFYRPDETLEKVNVHAFYDGAEVTALGEPKGFWELKSIKQVLLSRKIHQVHYAAFDTCGRLETIRVAKKNPAFQSIKGVLYSKGADRLIRVPRAYRGKSFTVPESVRVLEKCAFFGCKELREIILPEGLVSIGPVAFEMCESLRRIVLPKSLKKLGAGAFCGCKNLREVVFSGEVETIWEDTFQECSSLRELKFPAGTRNIYDDFSGCHALRNIHLPATARGLPTDSLHELQSLESITVSRHNPFRRVIGGVLYRLNEDKPASALYAPKGLPRERLELAPGITVIESNAFHGMRHLREIHIPEGVKRIEACAFQDCECLERVYLPDSLEYLVWGAFKGCHALKSVHRGKGSSLTVEKLAFGDCTSLRSVALGWVDSIPSEAFRGCDALESVRIIAGLNTCLNGNFGEVELFKPLMEAETCPL